MKISCENNQHTNNNHICCCLSNLIKSKYQYDSTFQTLSYSSLLLRTLSHCNKIVPLSSLAIPYSSLLSILDIITHCSSLFYFTTQYSYSKFLILIGLKMAQGAITTEKKQNKDLRKRKAALYNIISCIYLKEGKYIKAMKYCNKSLKYSLSKMDKAIAFNNLAIMYYSIASSLNCLNYQIGYCYDYIKNASEYIELSYSKIVKRLNKEAKLNHRSSTKQSKRESIALILSNYITLHERNRSTSSKSLNDISKLIQKGYDYSSKSIGEYNYITQFFNNKLEKEDSEIIILTPKRTEEDNVSPTTIEDIPTITIHPNENASVNANTPANNPNPLSSSNTKISSPPRFNKRNSVFIISNSALKPNIQQTQISNSSNDFFNQKSVSTPSAYKSITSHKNSRYQTKQNYIFSLENNKQKQAKLTLMSLFTPQSSNLSPSPKSISITSPVTPKPNPFDDLMKKLNDNEKAMNDFRNNYRTVEPTPKKITNERKRNTIQCNINNYYKNFKPNQNMSLIERKDSSRTLKIKHKPNDLFKDIIISYEEDMKDYSTYIDKCLNYDQYDILTNYYQIKMVNEDYGNQYLRTLFTIDTKNQDVSGLSNEFYSNSKGNDSFCIKYTSHTECYYIWIENNNEKANIKARITFDDESHKAIEEEYSYDDLNREINQIFYWTSIPSHCHINFITSTSMLIEQVLIYHLQLLKIPWPTLLPLSPDVSPPTQLSVGILSHPFTSKYLLFEFEFFNTLCIFNLQIRKNYTFLIMISADNESIYLRFNMTMDPSSFNLLFKLNEVQVPSSDSQAQFAVNVISTYYHSPSDSTKCLFIDFLIKLQEVMKHHYSNQHPSFIDLVELSNRSIYKIIFGDSIEKKELYILNHTYNDSNNKMKWVIDYYSISIIEISDSSLYMHKSLELTQYDFENILGVNPYEVISKMDKKNVIITNSILLNTVKLRNIMMKILTEENYDSMIRLVRLRPVCLFLTKAIVAHMRKYYCCSFELSIYSNEMYFIKITAMESSICRCYAKIYLPYLFNCNSNHIDDIKAEIEGKLSFIKTIEKKRIKEVLREEVLMLLVKTETLHMYDNINVLLAKLKKDTSQGYNIYEAIVL